MPVEKRVGFEDEQGFLPVLDASSEENEPEPIGWRTDRLFNWAIEEEELLAE